MDDLFGFRFMWKLVVASLKLGGYTFTFLAEVLWYTSHGRVDRIGDAIGHFGRGFTDAFTDVFK